MNFLREKLLRDREKKIRKDRWTKRILLIFFSSFFDFIEFNILNDFFLNSEDISISINVRYSAVATISSTLLCVYGLNFKIGRHQLFSMIGIAIFLILQYLIELSFSSNYLVCLQVFLLNILHLVLITFSDVIERYLADINFPNPFCILFGEGIFLFLCGAIVANRPSRAFCHRISPRAAKGGGAFPFGKPGQCSQPLTPKRQPKHIPCAVLQLR